MFISPSHLNLKYTLIMAIYNAGKKITQVANQHQPGPGEFSAFTTSTANNNVHRYDTAALRAYLEQTYKGKISDDAYQQIMLALSNYENTSWAPTGLQSFAERFGDYSSWQKFENEKMNNFNAVVSEILNAQHQEDFTNPVNEVARRAAAGINDDLNGGSQVGSGEPGDIALPENLPTPEDSSEPAIQIAEASISFVSQIMSFAQGIQSLQAGSLMNVAQDISNHSSAMDLIAEEVMSGLGISDIKDISKIDSAAFIDFLGGLDKDNSFNASTKRVLHRYYNTIKNDSGTAVLQAKKMELAERYFNSRKNVAGIVSSPLFDEDFEKYIGNFGERVSKLQQDLFEAQMKYQTALANGEYNNLESKLASEKAGYDANTAMNEQRAIIEGFFNDITHDLEAGDKWYHKFGLVLLPLFRGLLYRLFTPSFSAHASFGGTHDIRDTYVHGM